MPTSSQAPAEAVARSLSMGRWGAPAREQGIRAAVERAVDTMMNRRVVGLPAFPLCVEPEVPSELPLSTLTSEPAERGMRPWPASSSPPIHASNLEANWASLLQRECRLHRPLACLVEVCATAHVAHVLRRPSTRPKISWLKRLLVGIALVSGPAFAEAVDDSARSAVANDPDLPAIAQQAR